MVRSWHNAALGVKIWHCLGNTQSAGIWSGIAICNPRNVNEEDEGSWILQEFDNGERCR